MLLTSKLKILKLVIDEAVKEQEEKEEKQANIEMGQKIVAGLGTLFISPLILMFVWNLFIPGMFGLSCASYWTSMGLIGNLSPAISKE